MREWVAAYNARDVEAMVRRAGTDLELRSAFATLGGGVYHGHAGLRSWHEDMDEAWGRGLRFEMVRHFDIGESMLTFYVVHGRGSQSGVEVNALEGFDP